MIGKLKGLVDDVADDQLILDVQGVGYLLSCSGRTLRGLPSSGEAAVLWVESVTRDDGTSLYGFIDKVEQSWFRLLTTVQGVGARMALALLTALPPAQLSQAIMMQDKASLTVANGVGPKLAARILTELKDKAAKLDTGSPAGGGRVFSKLVATTEANSPAGETSVINEAVSALVNLGYNQQEAARGVTTAYHGTEGDAAPTLDGLIREGLRELAR